MSPYLHRPLLISIIAGLATSLLAAPTEEQLDRIAELVKAGKADEARIRAETLLEVFPGDPQLKRMLAMLPGEAPGSDSATRTALEGTRAGEVRDFGGIAMVWCPPGKFVMGSPENEPGRREWEKDETQRQVTLSSGFWLAKTETTQAQWEEVIKQNPSEFKGVTRPVENVSWEDCQAWLEEMNRKHPQPGRWRWDLPTEAQWEYACRAGSVTAYHFGNDAMSLSKYGNFADKNHSRPVSLFDNAEYKNQDDGVGEETAPVASYRPNAWGLFDLHGNVSEHCRDWVEWLDRYPSDPVTDPAGPVYGRARRARGGHWDACAENCRSAVRAGAWLDLKSSVGGFRAALVQAPAPPALSKSAGALNFIENERTPENEARVSSPQSKAVDRRGYTNSLGMRFLPGSGKERGDRLYGVHETRVKDFAAFLADSKYPGDRNEWLKNPAQTPDHPVVKVSFKDALAFCAWLSQKENLHYTLPSSDHYVADLAGGAAAIERPGNFDGADRWRFTAPSGSFGANPWRFEDVEGNVWEWCDPHVIHSRGGIKTLAGGSWATQKPPLAADPIPMLEASEDERRIDTGFRCLIILDAGSLRQ